MALILNGNCLDKMKGMADNSVDSIVTDPPYGLSFMGKKWDYDVPSVAVWREALRVLKPGGHILAFAGSRTYHRMAVNIEDAGFEIRDQIMWLYGSGFPKSLNVSKAIDKHLGAEREKVRKKFSSQQMMMKDGQNERPWQNKAKELGYHEADSDKAATPEAEQWQGWGTALKPAHEPIVLARKPITNTVAENVLEHGTGGINIDESRVGDFANTQPSGMSRWNDFRHGDGKYETEETVNIKEGRFPANVIHDGSEEVKELMPDTKGTVPSSLGEKGFWFSEDERSDRQISPGYNDEGSAARYFKEASFSQQEHEPIVLARKPLEGTVAENVLEHGTGALNIGESKIPHDDPMITRKDFDSNTGDIFTRAKGSDAGPAPDGRFPANIVHDGSDEVVSLFPQTKSVESNRGVGFNDSLVFGKGDGDFDTVRGFNDSGSAARFFYCAKASTAERNAGCEELQAQEMGRNQSSLEGGKMLTGSGNERSNNRKNFHPTVKPIALMEYLCRLITPPGGLILDPFMGSGTTGIAALRLGFEFVGIELSEEYVEIATARIAYWVDMDLTFDDENVVLERKPQAEWL